MSKDTLYKVVLSPSAESRYITELYDYMEEHFSPERCIEVDLALTEKLFSLQKIPTRGSIEKSQKYRDFTVRFILHKESRNFEIKILYIIEEITKKVLILDLFPTKMHPDKMLK